MSLYTDSLLSQVSEDPSLTLAHLFANKRGPRAGLPGVQDERDLAPVVFMRFDGF